MTTAPENNRIHKAQTPTKIIVVAALMGIGIFFFVIWAILGTGTPIIEARKRGEIVAKEFIPTQQAEEQITVGLKDGLKARITEGQYVLCVEVPRKGGHPYRVDARDKKTFDKYKVGDTFDVGPYLER